MKRHHSRKWSLLKILKVVIGTAPVASFAVGSYSAAGGGAKGATAALSAVSQSYTGFDPSTGRFNGAALAVGYVPLFGAWLFGKVASRVLRV